MILGVLLPQAPDPSAQGRKSNPRLQSPNAFAMSVAAAATIKSTLDANQNGKVSKTEYAVLDQNKDGKVTKHEAEDLDKDGKSEKLEKDLIDRNDDGKVKRKEVLQTPVADRNNDGKVTAKEIKAVLNLPPPPPLPHASAPPLPRPPPRSSWKHGYWDHYEDALDEFVMILVFIVSLQALVRGLHRKLTGRGKYKTVTKIADAYGPDPGLELANASDDEGKAQQPADMAPSAGDPPNASPLVGS